MSLIYLQLCRFGLICSLVVGLSLPVSATSSTPDLQATITQLTHLLDALKAAEKTAPRTSFDVSAVLANTELTPESLNTWVRENTWLVPYNGALRDAQGVLMDRVGNSLDRALLLQTMLRELGYDTHLAQATLTEDQAKQVLAERHPLPTTTTLPISTEAPEEAEKLIKAFNLDAVQLAGVKTEAEKQQQQLKSILQDRVDRQGVALLKLLGTPENTSPDTRYKALQDHWWVQYQEKDQWLDLDPTLPDELAKQIHSKPLKIHTVTKLSDLPPELVHSMQIRVILECASDKKLTEHVLVQTPAILPSEVLGKPLSVNHIAVNLPNNFNAGDLAAFKKILLEQTQWFPIITVADQQYFDQEYTPNCTLSKATPPQTGTQLDNKMNQVLDAFGTSETTPAKASDAFITALWLEYEIQTPNQPTQTIRRQLFDLIGAAQRATGNAQQPNPEQQLAWRLALLGDTEVLATAHGLSDDYLAHLSMEHTLQLRAPLIHLVKTLTTNTPSDPTQLANIPNTAQLPVSLYSFNRLRQTLAPSNYFTQINILSLHHYLTVKEQKIVLNQAFDIVNNELANTSHQFSTQVRQGVIDTNLEALLMEQICRSMEMIACSSISNTANAWEQSKPSNWQVVRDAQSIQSLPFSDDLKQQWQQALAQHQVLIVPKQAFTHQAQVNWWRIDPKTGATLGINEQGWGQSSAEYISLVRTTVTTLVCDAAASSVTGVVVCTIVGLSGIGAWEMGVTGSKLGAQIVLAVTDTVKSAYALNKAKK